MRLARVLGLRNSDEAEDVQVRERWRNLREAYSRLREEVTSQHQATV